MMALFLAWTACFAPVQDLAYKQFYKEGQALFDQGEHAQAAERFKDALRLRAKAGRFKDEGVFFIDYMPRYKIALCYETLDPVEARDWAQRSREALEVEAIGRRPRERAAYLRDIRRIETAAEELIAERDREYNRRLQAADALLDQHKFEDARKAYEALRELDAGRPETDARLGQIPLARDNYVKSQALDLRSALLNGELAQAKSLLGHIAGIDPDYAELGLLRGQIEAAETAAARPPPEPVATADPVEAEAPSEPEPTPVASSENQPEERDVSAAAPEKAKPTPPARPETSSQAGGRLSAADKQALREALLDTLKPYRRGDAESALRKLEEIDLPAAQQSGSYHWLKCVYVLTRYYQAENSDEAVLDVAAEALRAAVRLSPDFIPDRDLYPDYVINFFTQTIRE